MQLHVTRHDTPLPAPMGTTRVVTTPTPRSFGRLTVRSFSAAAPLLTQAPLRRVPEVVATSALGTRSDARARRLADLDEDERALVHAAWRNWRSGGAVVLVAFSTLVGLVALMINTPGLIDVAHASAFGVATWLLSSLQAVALWTARRHALVRACEEVGLSSDATGTLVCVVEFPKEARLPSWKVSP